MSNYYSDPLEKELEEVQQTVVSCQEELQLCTDQDRRQDLVQEMNANLKKAEHLHYQLIEMGYAPPSIAQGRSLTRELGGLSNVRELNQQAMLGNDGLNGVPDRRFE